MKKILGSLLFVFFLACNTTECHLFPLNEEYEWVYKTTNYNPDGSIRDTIIDTVKVANAIEHEGSTYYNLNMLLPVRNKDCNTISLLFNERSKKEIELKNDLQDKQAELFNQPFSGTQADCFVGTRIIGFKDRFKINGHDCFKTDELLTDCSARVFKKVVFFIKEKVGIVQVSTYEVLPSGKEILQYVQDLTSYNFLVEEN